MSIFSFFKFKSNPRSHPRVLHFKDNASAFQYATSYWTDDLKTDARLIGYVVSETERSPFTPNTHLYTVKLATRMGVVEVSTCGSIADDLARASGLSTTPIKPGDLVFVEVASYDSSLAIDDFNQYFIILSKLKPELDSSTNSFNPDVVSDPQ